MGLANNVDREMLSSLHFNDEFNKKSTSSLMASNIFFFLGNFKTIIFP